MRSFRNTFFFCISYENTLKCLLVLFQSILTITMYDLENAYKLHLHINRKIKFHVHSSTHKKIIKIYLPQKKNHKIQY